MIPPHMPHDRDTSRVSSAHRSARPAVEAWTAAAGPGADVAAETAIKTLYGSGRWHEAVAHWRLACRRNFRDASGRLLDAGLSLAQRYLNEGLLASSVELLIECARLAPQEPRVHSLARRVRARRPKVAFFCESEDVKFLGDIYRFVSQRYETRYLASSAQEQIAKLMQWCDIAWFEWCTGQLVVATQLDKVCHVVCRLHRYEAYRRWPTEVDWTKVDTLITVGNNYVDRRLRRHCPQIDDQTEMVANPNGVALERFAFKERDKGKNIACLGHINFNKNPALLLQCLHELRKRDPEYQLFFAGAFEDDGVLEHYLCSMISELDLEGAVHFDGYQHDVPGWLEDKHFLASASVVEGHPVNVIEAMARGIKPVIHSWPGAREFYPEDLIFRTPAEFALRIHDESYEPKRYRELVAKHYSLEKQVRHIDHILRQFEHSIRRCGKRACDGRERPFVEQPVVASEGALRHRDRRYYDARWDAAPRAETRFERERRRRVVDAIAPLGRQDLAIVDLGCGRGILAPHLLPFGSVVGVDLSASGTRQAYTLCPAGTFIADDVLHVDLPAASYDVAVSVEVLEHFENEGQQAYLRLAHRLLKPGGSLVLTTPNRPQVIQLNELYISGTGRPWSDQPIENWLDEQGLRWALESAGFEVTQQETLLSRMFVDGLHLFVVGTKPSEVADGRANGCTARKP